MRKSGLLLMAVFIAACSGSDDGEALVEATDVAGATEEEGGEESGEEGNNGESDDAQADAEATTDDDTSNVGGEGSTEEGGESSDPDAGGEESSEEGGEEGSTEEGGEGSVSTAPVGTWLLWTDTPGCGDADLFSHRLSEAKYAVLTVSAEGEASVLFHDAAYEQFRTYVLPTVEVAEGESYVVSVDEAVEEPEGSGCTINRKMTLDLELSLGSWAGTLEFSETKKGGGCFSDGCEGVMEIKTQELGNPVNPLYWEGVFPMPMKTQPTEYPRWGTLFYPVPDQPYFFELDITTVGASLQTIRGKKYIGGQGTSYSVVRLN